MTSTPEGKAPRCRVAKSIVHTVLLATAVCGALPATRLAAQPAAAASGGVIIGSVTNKTTGNGLEGAIVEIKSLGLSALVDKTGRYLLNAPSGAHELTVTYTGLDSQTSQVVVTAADRAVRNFELTSSIYMLDAFKVAGEREGNAAAITAQRNADNLKNVVSMDAYGNLPNLNATELAIRLPGVTFGNPGDEVVEVVSVRGMGAGMTTITIDGGMMSSFSAENRNTRMTAFTGAMFEQLEVVKGHTPDKGADSLGGTINFKTRSPLNMKEKRRISYNASVSTIPTWVDQVPIREKHRSHPLFNGAYIEKFRIFGASEENLALSVNMFYSENAFGFFRSQRDYAQNNNYPGYVWDYRTTDNYNNRKQMSINTKWDYRLSVNSLLKLNIIVNDAPEPMRRQYQTRAFAGSETTVPSATSGVVPGAFTNRVTVVRANAPAANANPGTAPTAAIDVTSTLINRNQRLRHADIGGEHNFGRFEIDWAGLYSLTRYRTLGAEGVLTNRIGGVPFIGPNGLTGTGLNTIVGPSGEMGVGWILDRTASDLYPKFIQNGGLDFTNPANYRPTQNGLSTGAGNLQQHRVRDVRGNIRYRVPTDALNLNLKTGGQAREQTVSIWNTNRRWSYIGRDALPTDPSIRLWDEIYTGRKIPTWEGAMFIQNGQPTNPALWQEDRYFYEQNRLANNYRIQETAYATYGMAQGRWRNNGFLGGVRWERTDTVSKGYLRSRRLSTTAEQLADPVGAAMRDYGNNWTVLRGSYNDFFPSIHLWRDVTPDLKIRGAWSTSFGRPSMGNARPTIAIDEGNQRITVGNPALLPQFAKNYDLNLEYYFKHAGTLSIGWFHKTISDYIVSNVEVGTVPTGPDNGYDGEYGGFAIRTTQNAGQAVAQGWEFSYLQQLRFLPGLLKGLSINTNYTIINTHGDFGAIGARRENGQVPGFIPRSANVRLSWRHRKFGASALYNYTATHIRSFNATQPSRNQYMFKREQYNLGVEYDLLPNLKLTLDVSNAFNEPQTYYRGIPDQLETFLMQGPKYTIGVQGRF